MTTAASIDLEALLAGGDPVAAARALGLGPGRIVTWTRAPAPADLLVDGDEEGAIEDHRRAHAAGRPSEATVHYGAGIPAEAVAERLRALGALAAETGLLRAICPVPGEGDQRRPGSWGYEDLAVIVAARAVAPAGTRVRPDWRRLGPAACQVAVAFGADEWRIPPDDRVDPVLLAHAVGAEPRETGP